MTAIKSYVNSVQLNRGVFRVNAAFVFRDREWEINEADYCVQIAGLYFPVHFEKKAERKEDGFVQPFFFQMVSDTFFEEKVNPVYWLYRKGTPEEIKRRIECQYIAFGDSFCYHTELPLVCYEAEVNKKKNHTCFFYQSINNLLSFTSRETYYSDSKKEQYKIKAAYVLASSFLQKFLKDKIVFFEKKCSRYEESASVLFERCVDEGITKARYIIDKHAKGYRSVPKKYKKYIVGRNSFMHYLLFFGSSVFLSSESVSHIMDTNSCSSLVRQRLYKKDFKYAFLQHGVMYMYSLTGRFDFTRGDGMARHAKVVVSSEAEAEHFIKCGKYRKENLIISGLPKFDRAEREKEHGKIIIMPTWRGFEYNVMKDHLEASTYYQFIYSIVLAVPEKLKKEIVVVPHPLVREFFMRPNQLSRYLVDEVLYDELLKKAELLITDYSSIAYDAFYRGAKVIFCWEEKEICLKRLGFSLMLNEENAFGDISYQFTDLQELILRNYYGEQSGTYIERYKKIVSFHDGKNTQRCFDALKKCGFFELSAKHKTALTGEMIFGIGKKRYTGFPVTQTKLEVICNGNVLIKDVDYLVEYKDNIDIGKAQVCVRGIGNYTGAVRKSFMIVGIDRK